MTTLSPHVLLTRAIFGLRPAGASRLTRSSHALNQARDLLAQIEMSTQTNSPARSTLVLLTGPSGAGKSTMLAAIRTLMSHRAPLPVLNMSRRIDGDRGHSLALIDELAQSTHASWHHIAHTLSRLGLAQPELWLRPMHTLSDGERSRARLALHLLRGGQESSTSLVLIDEFLSVLDRPTAQSVLSGVLRLLSECPGMLLVCATAHTDLVEILRLQTSHTLRIGECAGTVIHLQVTEKTPRPQA